MAIVLGTPGVDGLDDVVAVLRTWQDGAPVQLHPGDLGWFWRAGPDATAAAVRTWSRDGQVVAVGLLDGRTLLRSAFGGSTPPDKAALSRWDAMAAGIPFADARCLVGYDEEDTAVAVVTVWSAGAGRYGVIEPMGTHPEHRGRGHGPAITVAAAAALQRLGSSAAVVATPSANAGAVATYVAAGFERLPQRRDRRRDAP